MSIVINVEPRLVEISVDEDAITARLTDGRVVSGPGGYQKPR